MTYYLFKDGLYIEDKDGNFIKAGFEAGGGAFDIPEDGIHGTSAGLGSEVDLNGISPAQIDPLAAEGGNLVEGDNLEDRWGKLANTNLDKSIEENWEWCVNREDSSDAE